jgi:hypothetical protein
MPLDDVAARLPKADFGPAFCDCRVVDGRTRYRLHLGPFHSTEVAARLLEGASRTYPRAMIRTAEDAESSNACLRPIRRGPESVHSAWGDTSPPPFAPEGADVEPAASVNHRVNDITAIKTPDIPSPSRHFAVELLWSPEPLNLERVPPLTLFDDRTIYSVFVQRDSSFWHGLRVGFYRDGDEARQAAIDFTGYFASAIAVPATEREFAQARVAEIRAWAARIDSTVVVAA